VPLWWLVYEKGNHVVLQEAQDLLFARMKAALAGQEGEFAEGHSRGCRGDARSVRGRLEASVSESGSVDAAQYRAEWAREVLALRIIDMAQLGERDMEWLREDAVKHLANAKMQRKA
jgi:hypothetical protein